MFGAALALSLLVAGLVAAWLQSAVTRPVKAMTGAVRELIAQRDFSKRVNKTTDDETGMLVDAFNTMLSEIGSTPPNWSRAMHRSPMRSRSVPGSNAP